VITNAPRSLDDDYDRRRRRYAVLMSIRAICVLAAGLTYRVSIWLALAFVAGGAVLPWCAVLIANDRLPIKRTVARRPVPNNVEKALPPPDERERTIDG
jgi:hypothetical protein